MLTNLETKQISLGDSLYYNNLYKGIFIEEACYNNSFNLLSMLDKDCKGVIGYVLSTDGKKKVAVRHSWVVNKYNAIIDVTMPLYDYGIQSMLSYEYLPVISMTVGVWLDKIEKNNNIPCIMNIKGEKKIIKTLESEGFLVLGI